MLILSLRKIDLLTDSPIVTYIQPISLFKSLITDKLIIKLRTLAG